MSQIKEFLQKFKKWIIAILGISVASAAVVSLQPEDTLPEEKAIGWDEEVKTGEESLFAEINERGEVVRVIVADAEVINSGKFGNPKNWIRTRYSGEKRELYAGKGFVYDEELDTFKDTRDLPTPTNRDNWKTRDE